MNKFLVILASLLYATIVHSAGNDNKRAQMLTINQMQKLVLTSLTPIERRLPGLVISYIGKGTDFPDNNPRFFVFWAAEDDGTTSIGYRYTDPYTGDVFDGLNSCYEYHNKELKTLQKQYRHDILHLTEVSYRKLKVPEPKECEL